MGIDNIRTVLVAGTGRMGYGIIVSCALAGYRVRLSGRREESLVDCMGKARVALESYANHGVIKSAHIDDIMERITPVLDDENDLLQTGLIRACSDVDLIIETLPEDLEKKKKFFARADKYCPPHAIWGTNTSSILPTKIAADLPQNRKENFVGMHFFFPAHLMRLVELAAGKDTTQETMKRAEQFSLSIWKQPAVVPEISGYILNRLQKDWWEAGLKLVQMGISAETVDLIFTQVLGRRGGITGPLTSADMTGLKTVLEIGRNLRKDEGLVGDGPFSLVADLVTAGHEGKNTGRGIHVWPEEMQRKISDAREEELYRWFSADLKQEGVDLMGAPDSPGAVRKARPMRYEV